MLGKEDGKWVWREGKEYDDKERTTWGREWGGGEEVTKLKTSVISAAAQKKECLFCSGKLVWQPVSEGGTGNQCNVRRTGVM